MDTGWAGYWRRRVGRSLEAVGRMIRLGEPGMALAEVRQGLEEVEKLGVRLNSIEKAARIAVAGINSAYRAIEEERTPDALLALMTAKSAIQGAGYEMQNSKCKIRTPASPARVVRSRDCLTVVPGGAGSL